MKLVSSSVSKMKYCYGENKSMSKFRRIYTYENRLLVLHFMYLFMYVWMDGYASRWGLNGWTDFVHTQRSGVCPSLSRRTVHMNTVPKTGLLKWAQNTKSLFSKPAVPILINC
jgi:hypothetical protein